MPTQLVNALALSFVITFLINRCVAYLGQRKAAAASQKSSGREL